eukprot:1178172-Prorocentrum_minimum.AAC.2
MAVCSVSSDVSSACAVLPASLGEFPSLTGKFPFGERSDTLCGAAGDASSPQGGHPPPPPGGLRTELRILGAESEMVCATW